MSRSSRGVRPRGARAGAADLRHLLGLAVGRRGCRSSRCDGGRGRAERDTRHQSRACGGEYRRSSHALLHLLHAGLRSRGLCRACMTRHGTVSQRRAALRHAMSCRGGRGCSNPWVSSPESGCIVWPSSRPMTAARWKALIGTDLGEPAHARLPSSTSCARSIPGSCAPRIEWSLARGRKLRCRLKSNCFRFSRSRHARAPQFEQFKSATIWYHSTLLSLPLPVLGLLLAVLGVIEKSKPRREDSWARRRKRFTG